MKHYPRVLSIAGSDSGGGAGIQADLKTISALGCYGMTAITALTAQNTQGVRGIHATPPEFLKMQIEAVMDDIGADAVKIGMLHDPQIVEVVAWAIEHYDIPNVVLDPVMVATSGDRLITEDTVDALIRKLLPLATIITPNLDEAELLIGRKIAGVGDLKAAAQELRAKGAKNVLLKGGHLPGNEVTDLLLGTEVALYTAPRIASDNVHGTGCTLSSAIASFLAQGLALDDAVRNARGYILGAIAAGKDVKTGGLGSAPEGRGHGPLNHGFAPVAMKVLG